MELTKKDMKIVRNWPWKKQRWSIGIVENLKKLIKEDKYNTQPKE